MINILIAYATTEGHTRKVAQHIGGYLRSLGHDAEVVDTADFREGFNMQRFEGFLLLGSLHQGKHQNSLVEFVSDHREIISAVPNALLSISLTAAYKEGDHHEELQKCVDYFCQETQWQPDEWYPVAGALKYVEYDWLKRIVMRTISGKAGGDVDTSQDYEYTDWKQLDEFANQFIAKVTAKSIPAA